MTNSPVRSVTGGCPTVLAVLILTLGFADTGNRDRRKEASPRRVSTAPTCTKSAVQGGTGR